MRTIISLLLFLVTFFAEPLYADNLKGSPSSLQKQNMQADKEGLVRIQDDVILEKMKDDGVLTKLPGSVKIDSRLSEKWQWCLPQVANFLEIHGVEFINEFGRFIKVNSAVRTATRQAELSVTNMNAAPTVGEKMSSHLTGATIDGAKIGMNDAELVWMRKKLSDLEDEGLIEATEEHNQLVFHIMVFNTYLGNEPGNK